MSTVVALVIVGGAAILAAGVTAMLYRRRPDRITDRVDADRVARVEAQLRRSAADRVERRRPRALDTRSDQPDAPAMVGSLAPLFHPDPAQDGTAGTAQWFDGERVRVDRD